MFQVDIGEIRNSYTAYDKQATCFLKIPVSVWRRYRDKGNLGVLYGIDVSNYIYKASNFKIKAYNPVVDDRQRARKGIKTIELTYYWYEEKKQHA